MALAASGEKELTHHAYTGKQKYYGADMRKREAWEAIHGPVPENHCLIYLDKNPDNKAPENLVCVSYSVMRTMAEHGLFSTDPEITKVGITIAEHRLLILRSARNIVNENIAIMLPEIKSPINCIKCRRIKCKHWRFSLRDKQPPTCTKYNLPITDILKITKEYKDRRKDRPKKDLKAATATSLTSFFYRIEKEIKGDAAEGDKHEKIHD